MSIHTVQRCLLPCLHVALLQRDSVRVLLPLLGLMGSWRHSGSFQGSQNRGLTLTEYSMARHPALLMVTLVWPEAPSMTPPARPSTDTSRQGWALGRACCTRALNGRLRGPLSASKGMDAASGSSACQPSHSQWSKVSKPAMCMTQGFGLLSRPCATDLHAEVMQCARGCRGCVCVLACSDSPLV